MDYSIPNGNITPPSFLMDIWQQGASILVEYGWYLVFLAFIAFFYWPSIRRYLDKLYEEKSDKEYTAKCKKDPDWLHKRQQEMEAARKKMQEELNVKAALHAAKMKEKEEQLLEQRIAAASTSGGHRLGSENTARTTQASSTPKKSHRPEYNPLMGSGGSGGYRPPRRGCPGGGCG